MDASNAVTLTVRQFVRRVKADPAVPDLAKEHLLVVFSVVKGFLAASRFRQSQEDVDGEKTLDFSGKEFSPAYDYYDLVQDLLATMIYQVIPKYDPALGTPFTAWAYPILKRRIRRLWEVDRSDKGIDKLTRPRRLEDWMSSQDTLCQDAIEATDSMVAVRQFAQVLTKRQRAVFNLKYADDRLSNREIALMLGLSNKMLVKRELDAIKNIYLEYAMQEHLKLPASVFLST